VDPAALLEPLARAPNRSALIFDLDGTLAPIVARPELARVPDPTRREMRRLAERYLLVACLSGRPGPEAEMIVGVEGVRYVGNHGLELHPEARTLADEVARFRDEIDSVWPIEDKGLTLSFHFREATDQASALSVLEGIAERARGRGLDARWGRKVLEIRPSVAADKGTAVQALLEDCGAQLGLYVGDDATDLDAYRGLGDAGLEHAVRVAVASPEAPPGLIEQADLTITDPAALLELLRLL
jgi:trehalose 6-phosphate phosphatase